MLKEKIKGILRNVNLIFTHNEETNKQFLINFKNNKIKSTFNLENLNFKMIIKFFACKWKIIFN